MSDIAYDDTPAATGGGNGSGPNHPDIRDTRRPLVTPTYGDIAAALPASVRKKFKRLRADAERSRPRRARR